MWQASVVTINHPRAQHCGQYSTVAKTAVAVAKFWLNFIWTSLEMQLDFPQFWARHLPKIINNSHIIVYCGVHFNKAHTITKQLEAWRSAYWPVSAHLIGHMVWIWSEVFQPPIQPAGGACRICPHGFPSPICAQLGSIKARAQNEKGILLEERHPT